MKQSNYLHKSITCFIFGWLLSVLTAQNVLTFSYDADGNRIERSTSTTRTLASTVGKNLTDTLEVKNTVMICDTINKTETSSVGK